MHFFKNIKNNKINRSNLPYLITVLLFALICISTTFTNIVSSNILFYFIEILIISIVLFIFIICPISLFFQIKNKNKTKFDKIILTLNFIGTSFVYLTLTMIFMVFPTLFVGEKQVRAQVSKEYEILNKEYKPVLEYLEKYKERYGKYPDKIDKNILPNSKTFDSCEYYIMTDGKGYGLKVYPNKGPIEYYHNDENDDGYNFYQGNGYIDGFLDNDNYYEIDDKWHAITVDYFSRHSILHKILSKRE